MGQKERWRQKNIEEIKKIKYLGYIIQKNRADASERFKRAMKKIWSYEKDKRKIFLEMIIEEEQSCLL